MAKNEPEKVAGQCPTQAVETVDNELSWKVSGHCSVAQGANALLDFSEEAIFSQPQH